MDISKRVFGSNVSKKIRNYINKLQEGTFNIKPGEEVTVDFNIQTYLGDRTPYSRMWTAITKSKVIWGLEKDKEGKEITGGKKKWNKVGERENFVYSINENRDNSYEELEPITTDVQPNYKYKGELGNNPYLKPSAGIKSVNSKSEGSLGALRRTTVEFVVHNKQDFEQIYLPYFLKPGATVFIDFGWSDKAFRLYNPEGILGTYNDIQMKRFWKDIVQKNQDSIEGGFQNTIAGNVVKYDVNVDKNGSFNCTLEVTSGNYRLLDKTINDDNSLNFIFDTSIEELLLGYYARVSGIDVAATDFVNLKTKKELKPEDKLDMVRQAFDLSSRLTTDGLMTLTAKRTGIFFQQQNTQGKLTDKESLYISYALLEDKFLNNFISEWVELDEKTGKVRDVYKSNNSFSPSFTSIHSYIRYDENLFTMTTKPYQKEDKLISFLYPNTWDEGDTYNNFKPIGWGGTDIKGVTKTGTQVDKEKRRIPLRELFISVPLISEAFKQAENVNDALEFIFERIKQDSGDIINIKMISPNDSQSALTFTDINVEADTEEEPLKFDITSGNTIVQNFDLKMETPKAGLASMIAIGNLKQPTVFSELELMKFNLLNSLNDNSKYQVQHLPVYSDINTRKKALTLQIDKILMVSDNKVQLKDADLLKPGAYELYKKKRGMKGKKKTKTIGSDHAGSILGGEIEVTTTTTTDTEVVQEGYDEFDERAPVQSGDATVTNNFGWDIPGQDRIVKNNTRTIDKYKELEKEMPEEAPTGEKILYATSERDEYLLRAKIENFVKSGENSISPVMPITLSLKVYGNNFLSYGDFFTVNYLPKHYQDRVYFQIVGVDHAIDPSGWSTNYTTVMRLKSNQKYRSLSDNNIDNQLVKIRFHDLYKDIIIDDITNASPEGDLNEGLASIASDIKPGIEAEHKIDDSIRAELERQGITKDHMPDIAFKEKIVTLDPVEKREEYEKKLKELGSDKVSIIKWPMSVNLKDMADFNRVWYWLSISNLILGDELINWELATKENENETFTKVELSPWNKKVTMKTASENNVYIAHRLDTEARERNGVRWSENWAPSDGTWSVNKSVLDLFDDLVIEASEFRRSDSAQREIDGKMFAWLKNKTSKFLQFDSDAWNNRFGSKRGEKETGNPFLFRSMFWAIPKEQTSEWSVIEISGTPEVDILPKIIVPRKYLKIKPGKDQTLEEGRASSLKEINRKWHKQFVTGKALSEEDEKLFTTAHYN